MALPNDSVLQTEGAGTTLATHLIGSNEYQMIQEASSSGHIRGTVPAYYVYTVPRATTITAIAYFDLFNPTGSGKKVVIRGLYSIVQQVGTGNAAVISYYWDVYKTSTAATGGTAFTYAPAAPTTTQGDMSIVPIDSTAPTLSGLLTGRGAPSGGGTLFQYMFGFGISGSVTNPAGSLQQGINWIPELPDFQTIELAENEGIKILQATASSSGTTNAARFGFIMAFTVR